MLGLIWNSCIDYFPSPSSPSSFAPILVMSWDGTVMAEASGSPRTALATFDRCKQVHSDKVVLLLIFFSLSWVDLLFFFLKKNFGFILCFSHWGGEETCISFHVQPFLTPVIQPEGSWVQHNEICQIPPHCPRKIAPTESQRTVFWGLRSLCLVYNAWRKGLSSDSPWGVCACV